MKEETKKWLNKAERDLETAEYNFKGEKMDAAVFYSQQVAEKALKSLQIEKFNNFDKVHDLLKLAEKVNANKHIEELCDKINPAYFVSRYPDIEEKYNKKEVEEVLDAAKEVLRWIKKELEL